MVGMCAGGTTQLTQGHFLMGTESRLQRSVTLKFNFITLSEEHLQLSLGHILGLLMAMPVLTMLVCVQAY